MTASHQNVEFRTGGSRPIAVITIRPARCLKLWWVADVRPLVRDVATNQERIIVLLKRDFRSALSLRGQSMTVPVTV
jgi:hypothetical protein